MGSGIMIFQQRLFTLISLIIAFSTFNTQLSHSTDSKGIVLFSGYPHTGRDLYGGIDDPDVVGIEYATEWKDLEPREGEYDWEVLDTLLETWGNHGKFVDLRIMPSNADYNVTPNWIFEDYNIRRIAPGIFTAFEGTASPYNLGSDASLTAQPSLVLAGSLSLVVNRSSASNAPFLTLSNTSANLEPLSKICIQLEVESDTERDVTIHLVPASLGLSSALEKTISVSTGSSQTLTATFILENHNDYDIELTMTGSGSLVVDNINTITTHNFADDFERDNNLWFAGTGSGVVTTSDSLFGERSFRGISTTGGYQPFLQLNPNEYALAPSQFSRVQFHYKALQNVECRFMITSLSGGGSTNRNANWWFWNAGESGTKTIFVSTTALNDYILEWGIEGTGEVLIDRIEVTRLEERFPEFPNFFNPDLKAVYLNTLDALSERYKDYPALNSLSIGPIGRWDEMILNGDLQGQLDNQWVAHGYSDERYINHILWAIDAYQSRFPDKKFQLQMAYGLQGYSNEEVMWRRVAALAARTWSEFKAKWFE